MQRRQHVQRGPGEGTVWKKQGCGWSTGRRGKSGQVMLVCLGSVAMHGLRI